MRSSSVGPRQHLPALVDDADDRRDARMIAVVPVLRRLRLAVDLQPRMRVDERVVDGLFAPAFGNSPSVGLMSMISTSSSEM